MPRKDTNSGPSTAQAQQDAVSDGIDAYELPKSLVTRIARSAIPENAKLQKETVLALMKGSTVFINYLAAIAHDVASQKQHKSVSASDVMKALEMLDLGDMGPMLQTELQAYRDNQKGDKGKRGGAKAKAKGAAESVSANSKGKAKTAASHTITIPGRATAPPLTDEHLDADEHMEVPAARAGDDDEEMVDGDEEDIDEVEDEDEVDEDEDEGEEIEDEVAMEEEEIRRDARGVEERSTRDLEDDD